MDYNKQLDDLKKTMTWLINGYGQHGLSIKNSSVNWDWICENYNVDTFECLHKKVIEIGYVVAFDDKTNEMGMHFDGFCTACDRMVSGFISSENKIKRGWLV